MPIRQNQQLETTIRELGPWHQDIELDTGLSIGSVFSESGQLAQDENDGVSLFSMQKLFMRQTKALYPNGMKGKRFLDCACNAGAYCFYARELDAEFSFGFDVREHWIKQANFVQQNRTIAPTDRIEFRQMDVYDLRNAGLESFDLTYFKGIFYHLPDPVHCLQAAADLTTDVMMISTAGLPDSNQPPSLILNFESDEHVMAGVHRLAWIPSSPEVLVKILQWLGFKDVLVTMNHPQNEKFNRYQIYAARESNRLSCLDSKSNQKQESAN